MIFLLSTGVYPIIEMLIFVLLSSKICNTNDVSSNTLYWTIFKGRMNVFHWNFIKFDSDAEAKANLLTAILVSNVKAASPERICRRSHNVQCNVNWFNNALRKMRDILTMMQEVYTGTNFTNLKENIIAYRYWYRLEIVKTNDI